jgi:hypothetical protein
MNNPLEETQTWIIDETGFLWRSHSSEESIRETAEIFSKVNYFQVKLSTDIWEDEEN